MPDQPQEFAGTVIITWPQPVNGALPGCEIKITDGESGEPLYTVSEFSGHLLQSDASSVVWAELTMFADREGKPVYGGEEVFVKGGKILTGTFPFLVSEMRLATGEGP